MGLDVAQLAIRVQSLEAKLADERLDKLSRTSGRAEKGVSRLGAKAQIAARAMNGLKYAAAGVVATLSIGSLMRAAQGYTSMSNGLKALGQSQAQANQTIGELAKIAARTRAPLEATVGLYQKASIAAKELGASQGDVLKFTENVGLALAQQGGGAQQASGALLQLSQSLAGGVVRAEEFNSILEGAYPIALAAAKGIDAAGGSVGKLRNLVVEGKVSSKEFFDAILSQSGDLQAAFANTTITVGQAMQVFRDQFMLGAGAMDQAAGASESFATAIYGVANGIGPLMQGIADNFHFIEGGAIAAGIAAATAYAPSIWAAVAATKAWVIGLVSLKGALVTSGIGAFVVLAGSMIGKLKQTRQAALDYQGAIDGLAGSQSDLTKATDEYLRYRSAATAEMMTMAAQAARDATASALEAAKAELEAAKFYTNFFGASLWETERMATATQSIASLEGALISAEARLSAAQASAGQFSKGLSDAAGAAGGLGGKLSDLSSSARSAIPPAAELIAKYGDLGETVKRAMEAQNALADAATQADISGVVAQAKTLAEQLGLGADKAASFRQDLEALSSTDPFGEQARELQRMAAYLLDVNGSVSQMSEQTREVYGNLNAAAIMAADLAGGAQRSHAWVDAVSGAASSAFRNLAAAGGGARRLAAGLLAAYNASRNLLGSLNGVARSLGQVGTGMIRMAGAIIPPIAGLETAARQAGGSIGNMLGSIAETTGLSQFARQLGNAGKAMTGIMVETAATAAAADIAAASLNGKTGGSGGGLGGAAKAAAEKLTEAEEAAKEMADSFKGKVVSAIDGVSSAFGDFVVGGFRDLKGFVSNVLNSFKRMLSEMIALAAKNRIMVALGLSVPAAGGISGVAQQVAGGGGVGGMLSGFLGKALGSWGGGSGILGGMGSVVGGLMNGGLSGAISGLGSALGGGLTSAIGGLIPVVGVAAAAFSFFKTKTKELNRGIEVSIKGTDAWTWQFKKMQKTRFWGLSKKKSTEWERASAQIADPIKKAYLDIRRSTEGMAKSIGASTRALDGYRKTITLDTKGMSPEEAQRALLEKMQGVSNDLASRVIGRRFARDGETATETLQAMAVSLGAINDAFRGLGLRAMRGGVVSANAARNIIEQVGGVQAFQQAADHYFGAFYSLPEQAKMIGQKLRAEMRAVGVAGSISTTKQFRAMVDRLNRQGRNAAAASLIALSPMFSQWKQLTEQVAANSGAELKAAQEAQKQRADLIAQQREGLMRRLYELLGNTVALRRMDLKALDPANHAYQRRIWQLEDEKKWLDKVNTARGEWSLDASKYATAAEAKMAAELRESKERDQKVIDAQNVELRRHSDLLAQVRDLLTRQTKNSDASLTLAQMG